jgi:flagellar hook protein FlgE
MSAIGAAVSGIQAASYRLDNAANNIANLSTPGFRAGVPAQTAGPAGVQVSFSPSSAPADAGASNVDLPAQMVEMIVAQHSAEANVATIRTQDEVTRSVLDILA